MRSINKISTGFGLCVLGLGVALWPIMDRFAPSAGDLDLDSAVDSADLVMLLGAWEMKSAADLNGSGLVDAADLVLLMDAWGPCTLPGGGSSGS